MARRRISGPDPVTLLRRLRAPWWAILLAVLVLLALRHFSPDEAGPPIDPADPVHVYVVDRVVDGDTLVLTGGERVRLIGVDTPETVAHDRPVEPFGPEASRFTERTVEGKQVRLAFDKERRDRYGRTLAYVYIGDVLLNEELLRAGYGRALLHYPYSAPMKRRFREAEAEAKAARRGVWSSPTRGDVGDPHLIP